MYRVDQRVFSFGRVTATGEKGDIRGGPPEVNSNSFYNAFN